MDWPDGWIWSLANRREVRFTVIRPQSKTPQFSAIVKPPYHILRAAIEVVKTSTRFVQAGECGFQYFTDTRKMKEAIDGELFWEMSTGRGPIHPGRTDYRKRSAGSW